MAGRTGSRQQRLMLLLAAAASVTALAQPQPAAPKTAAPVPAAKASTSAPAKARKQDLQARTENPDPALIAFLGEYADAADGLDPMGLAEHADAMKNATKDPHKP